MKFFFDNCVAPRFAAAIHALIVDDGHQAIHLRDRFPPDTKDIDWLTALGEEGGWIIISGDIRISRNQHEKAAWLEAKLTTFFLSGNWQNLSMWEQAAKLVQRWPLIMDQAGKVEPGAGFEVKPKSPKFVQVR